MTLPPSTFLARIWFVPAFSMLIAAFSMLARANDTAWPEGFQIHEGSGSPNSQFGVLVPSRENGEEMDDDKIANTLVNLKTRDRVAVIKGAHYFAGRNHSGLEVKWADDSSRCIVTYDGRFGFDTIAALALRDSKCNQADPGSHIQKALDAAIAAQAGDSSADGCANAYFRFAPDGNILVRATGTTNPKGFEDQHTYCAVFQGTFNLANGKWIKSETRKVTSIDDLYSAFSDGLFEDTTFGSDENRLSSYDDKLNEVYRSVRLLLPKDRFSPVKQEQIAWLKKLEACSSVDQKCDLIASRISELRQLVW